MACFLDSILRDKRNTTVLEIITYSTPINPDNWICTSNIFKILPVLHNEQRAAPRLISLSLVFMNQFSSLTSRFQFSKRPHFGGNLNRRGSPDCEAENCACCLGRAGLSRTERKVLRGSGTGHVHLLWADLRRTAEARPATGCIHKVSASHQLQEISPNFSTIKPGPESNWLQTPQSYSINLVEGRTRHSRSRNHKNLTLNI